jgi:hypothetical protein
MRVVSILTGLNEELQEKFFEVMENFSPERMDNLRSLLTGIIYDVWTESAIDVSPSLGPSYAKTIKIKESGLGTVYADEGHHSYKFVEMMEDGVSPWSIRDALLKSTKVKISKRGVKYIIVPFKYRTPTKKGEGKVLSSFAGVIPSDVYSLVKAGGKVTEGKLAGLKRYGGKQHGQYFTFRMVSENTPSNKWRHPGKSPTPVYPDIVNNIQGVVTDTITNMILGIKNASN